jgi:hypothetical protein
MAAPLRRDRRHDRRLSIRRPRTPPVELMIGPDDWPHPFPVHLRHKAGD